MWCTWLQTLMAWLQQLIAQIMATFPMPPTGTP